MTEPRLCWSQLPAAPTTPINQTIPLLTGIHFKDKAFRALFQPTCDTQDMDFHHGTAIQTVVRGAAQTMGKSGVWYFARGTFKQACDDPALKDPHATTFNSSQSIVWMSFLLLLFFFQTSNNPCCARSWQYGGSCGVMPLTRYYQCCTFNRVQYSAMIVKLCLNGP